MDSLYRRKMAEFGKSHAEFADMGAPPWNHSITCPVCLGETTFWRESPFPLAPLPTDGRVDLDGSPFSLSVKAMLSDMNL